MSIFDFFRKSGSESDTYQEYTAKSKQEYQRRKCGTHGIAYYVDSEFGTHIGTTHQMNLILEKMGLIVHNGNIWMTTAEGCRYTIFRDRTSTNGNGIWYLDDIGPLVGNYIMNDAVLRRRYYD